jgi:predicted enzyme involved in methoxymalonyl-ACP biosynthesis
MNKEHTESLNWEKIKILITDLDYTLWQGILDEKKD